MPVRDEETVGKNSGHTMQYLYDPWILCNERSRHAKLLQGIGEPCSLKSLSGQVLAGKVKDHQNVQHVLSSCWMPIWLAFKWESASIGEKLDCLFTCWCSTVTYGD